MLDRPELTQKIIERKYQYIFQGYHELDFPFPEITPTFDDIKTAISKQLTNIEQQLKLIAETDTSEEDKHNKLFKKGLEFVKNNLILIQDRLHSLAHGVIVVRKADPHKENKEIEQVTVDFPYGKCIELCADYVELCDLAHRVQHRFDKFGPSKLYFNEALHLSKPSNNLTFQEYLQILEKQDYITSFHKILNRIFQVWN
jgi:hypothetical protein